MQSKAIICKFHSSPTKKLAFYALLSLFFHELITLQRQVQTIFYLIFLVRSLFSFFFSRNFWSWISMIVYLRVCHKLVRIWDTENNFVSILCAYSSSLWNSRNQTFDHQNLTTFWIQLLHSFVYDRKIGRASCRERVCAIV